MSNLPELYTVLLAEVKARIRSAQYAALRAVNQELIHLYWDIGRLIVARQAGETFGRSIVESLAVATYRIVKELPPELRAELPNPEDFARLLA